MRVFWLGINDERGCVLQWHELRLELRDHHGVELHGPGYSWESGPYALSDLLRSHGSPDWIVLDDCNALGYVPIQFDVRPTCRLAWREHDFHNRHRNSFLRFHPELVMGCCDREGKKPPNWVLLPHPVNTTRFHPGNGQYRPWTVGLYGKVGRCYAVRTRARQALQDKTDAWLPVHGGYWKDGKPHNDGVRTFYNDKLADALRKVFALWTDGSDWDTFLQKHNEAAASGCLILGKKPYAWEDYYPRACFVECEPEQAYDVARHYRGTNAAAAVTGLAWEHCRRTHSIEARAEQIMELLKVAS